MKTVDIPKIRNLTVSAIRLISIPSNPFCLILTKKHSENFSILAFLLLNKTLEKSYLLRGKG